MSTSRQFNRNIRPYVDAGLPTGNTGGANVSPFKAMPIDPDLAEVIRRAAQP